MRSGITVGLLGLALLASPTVAQAQSAGRMNPMIALHEKGLPVFGITHPAITAGRGGGGGGGRAGAPAGGAAAAGARAGGGGAAPAGGGRGGAGGGGGRAGGGGGAGAASAAPAAPIDLAAAARETLGYKLADFQYSSAGAEQFMPYLAELIKAGGSARTHAFIEKTGVFNRNPEQSTQRIHAQLNAGHVGIMTEAVQSAQEIRDVIAAMRFTSKGGTRPETGIAQAAAYWGMTEAQYKEKADVWPLNPNGELILWAIVESREGLSNLREIAATPGIGVLWAGAGTLGGVFTPQNPDGSRGQRDEAGYQAALASVLAACKEFRIPCGFPASNPADIERLMAEGWSVFVMQQRGENGFAAIEAGRRLSNRPAAP
jgi:4-hydroxy-2-oxoheptanedioate aldolase